MENAVKNADVFPSKKDLALNLIVLSANILITFLVIVVRAVFVHPKTFEFVQLWIASKARLWNELKVIVVKAVFVLQMKTRYALS
jgi:hypothetical protein